MICNIHERSYPVSTAELGELLDSLAGPDDRLWPTRHWPPIHFDAPLGTGAKGGHGPIPYAVTGYEPGRRLLCEFRFAPVFGVRGTHELEVRDGYEPGTAMLRHVIIVARTSRWFGLVWSTSTRWLHDALLEDLLDQAAVALGQPPSRPARWSPWVRVLRRLLAAQPR